MGMVKAVHNHKFLNEINDLTSEQVLFVVTGSLLLNAFSARLFCVRGSAFAALSAFLLKFENKPGSFSPLPDF